MAFGKNLIALRRGRGLSQEELGEAVGVSRQTVSKWETGQTTPELDKLMTLADLFGLALDELVGRVGKAEEDTPLVEEEQPAMCSRRGRPWVYEYVSRHSFHGVPLVHIHLGFGAICRARGIVAVGNLAAGVVAIGGLSAGVISFGGLSVGLVALGGFTIGAIACGGVAVGLLALGGVAAGIRALGGLAVGRYAIGGMAVGVKQAVGDYIVWIE